MLLLSDAHFSEVVDPRVAMGLVYNEDIAKRRIERVRDVTIRYKQLRESSYPIQKLTVAVLGDMLSGDIHEELEVTNQNPLPVALVTLAYYLHDMATALTKATQLTLASQSAAREPHASHASSKRRQRTGNTYLGTSSRRSPGTVTPSLFH